MFRKSFLILFSLFIFLSSTVVFAETNHEWTGLLFRNGNSNRPEQGGPFKTKEECFAWGKSHAWRKTDEYRCGMDCVKDSIGHLQCYSIGKEGLPPASPSPVASPSASPAAGEASPNPSASPSMSPSPKIAVLASGPGIQNEQAPFEPKKSRMPTVKKSKMPLPKPSASPSASPSVALAASPSASSAASPSSAESPNPKPTAKPRRVLVS